MKNTNVCALPAIAAALVMLCSAAPAASQTVKRYTIEQFMKTISLNGVSFTHDEKQILFSSNESGIFNVHSVSVAGGQPIPLTRSTKESTFSLDGFPNDSRFLYTFDQGGNELAHIYTQDSSGKQIDLTPSVKGKAIKSHIQSFSSEWEMVLFRLERP
jgi:Tol biopolymer transport system component